LVPSTTGWVCRELNCDYTQEWAHDFMLDGSALSAMISFREEHMQPSDDR
jgi:hypothetical protein